MALIVEANAVVQGQIVKHERDDEGSVYPELSKVLMDRHGLSAMSRAHREIQHLARLLAPRGRGPSVGENRSLSRPRRSASD